MATHLPTNPITTIDQRIEDWIDCLASTVIGSYGFVESDRDDLKQEMRLALLEAQPAYQSGRSCWHTFANRIIKARLMDLVRERTSIKRGHGALNAHCNGTCAAQIDEGVLIDHPGSDPIDPSGEADLHRAALAIDLSQVISRLPAELRRIAERLMQSDPKDAWRELGMKKSTFYEAIARLRVVFAKAGLDPAAN
jgi:DNA-directed RNA polymerase specialized sigma24 family protein